MCISVPLYCDVIIFLFTCQVSLDQSIFLALFFFLFPYHVPFFLPRPETAEEKMLKEEISSLKAELTETEKKDPGEVKDLEKIILQKETDLEQLIIELDNKVRFGQRSSADTRLGSGAGRIPVYQQPGSSEEPRISESVDRPSSGGSSRGDSWARPVEEKKWGFQGPHNRSSLGGSSDR